MRGQITCSTLTGGSLSEDAQGGTLDRTSVLPGRGLEGSRLYLEYAQLSICDLTAGLVKMAARRI